MTKKNRYIIELCSLITFGAIFLILFSSGKELSIKAIVTLFLCLAVWGIISARSGQLAILQRLMIFLYSMPFIVTTGYLFNDDYNWGQTPLISAMLMDQQVVFQMVGIGLVGLMGLLVGMKSAEIKIRYGPNTIYRAAKKIRFGTLGLVPFFLFLGSALFLSYLSASKELIFDIPYATEGMEGISQAINFYAASLMSYLILTLLYVDYEQEFSRGIRRIKIFALMLISLYVIVYLQVLRGNRECIGLITAFIALYITNDATMVAIRKQTIAMKEYYKRILKIMVPCLLIFIAFVSLGSARFLLSSQFSQSYNVYDFVEEGFKNNTWTSVLLTNLGLAQQVQNSHINYLAGQTYVDYVLSLPPGIMTRLMGFERPLEASVGPNWWYVGISGGGIHPVVVPYLNFGILGTFVILAMYGVIIVHIDNPNKSRFLRFIYGAFFVSSFTWFWYGDMNIIRAVMGAVILWGLYRTILLFQRTLVRI